MDLDNKLIRSLLVEAQLGNNSAYKQLFQITVDRIFGLALRLLADSDEAEEVTIDTYIETWRSISTIRKDSSFTSWLVGIVVYKSLEKIRKDQEERTTSEVDKTLRFEYTESDPIVRQLETELFTNLQTWDRIIFVLNKIENYSLEEIADLTQRSKKIVGESIESTTNQFIRNFQEFSNLKDFELTIEKVPDKIPPDADLWQEISEQAIEWKKEKVDKQQEEFKEQEIRKLKDKHLKDGGRTKEKKKRVRGKRKTGSSNHLVINFSKKSRKKFPLKWVLSIVIVAAIVIWYFLFGMNTSWKVNPVTGQPKVNGQIIQPDFSFTDGDNLITDQNSEAILEVPLEAKITVHPLTRINKGNEKREFELTYGSISFDKSNADMFFTVITPSVTVTDYYVGGQYDLTVGKDGNTKITVKDGWVILKRGAQEVILPQLYTCQVYNNSGIGIPYRKDSSERLKNAVEDFNMNGQPDEAFTNIVLSAEKSDAVTLWHLLQKVKASKRSATLDRLVQFAPLPEGVTRGGILALDKDMLQKWLNEIEFILSES